jgi:hypothetical protein
MAAVPDICAWTEAPAATNINVAASIDLMGSLGYIEEYAIKHICLVGNNRPGVQGTRGALILKRRSPHHEERETKDMFSPC